MMPQIQRALRASADELRELDPRGWREARDEARAIRRRLASERSDATLAIRVARELLVQSATILGELDL